MAKYETNTKQQQQANAEAERLAAEQRQREEADKLRAAEEAEKKKSEQAAAADAGPHADLNDMATEHLHDELAAHVVTPGTQPTTERGKAVANEIARRKSAKPERMDLGTESYIYNGTVYGPGVVDVPLDVAISIRASQKRAAKLAADDRKRRGVIEQHDGTDSENPPKSVIERVKPKPPVDSISSQTNLR
jgi:hypothetical protein